MTDTVADPNQVTIAMLGRLAAEPMARPPAVHGDTGDDRPARHTPGSLRPGAQHRIGPGEQK